MLDFVNVTVINFKDLPWFPMDARAIIQAEGFGGKAKAACTMKGRGPFLIQCDTANKAEMMIRLGARVAYNAFGLARIHPVFADNLQGVDPKDFNNLFLSEDGEDQWPVNHMHLGETTARGAESSLNRDTSYYFMLPEFTGGHPSINGKESVRLSYSSLHDDEIEEFEASQEGVLDATFIFGNAEYALVKK